MQKHNPIEDLVNAKQRNLQYTAEANASSNRRTVHSLQTSTNIKFKFS